MRITCPICGERDLREFYYAGVALERPAPDAGEEAWDAYTHSRENPAGVTRDYWVHEQGCGAWLIVTRNTVTHEVIHVELAKERVA
ncbi:MAG: sarcosine oxidase subunit delta [Shimia sp.]